MSFLINNQVKYQFIYLFIYSHLFENALVTYLLRNSGSVKEEEEPRSHRTLHVVSFFFLVLHRGRLHHGPGGRVSQGPSRQTGALHRRRLSGVLRDRAFKHHAGTTVTTIQWRWCATITFFTTFLHATRVDFMCSNCLTTTPPVGCPCSSWSSLNASPYPGSTVGILTPETHPHLILHQKAHCG